MTASAGHSFFGWIWWHTESQHNTHRMRDHTWFSGWWCYDSYCYRVAFHNNHSGRSGKGDLWVGLAVWCLWICLQRHSFKELNDSSPWDRSLFLCCLWNLRLKNSCFLFKPIPLTCHLSSCQTVSAGCALLGSNSNSAPPWMQLTWRLFCDEICNYDLKKFCDVTRLTKSLSQKGRFSPLRRQWFAQAIDADRVPSLSISLYLTIITRRNVGLGDTPPGELGDKIIQ